MNARIKILVSKKIKKKNKITMQRYIEQIIGDLKESKKNVPPDPELENTKNYEDFEEKMFAIETAPSQHKKDVFGVSFEELPPPEKLTDKQIEQLLDAIEDTFEAFNISIEYKDNMPIKLKYDVLRDSFKYDIHIMPGFSMHFDFCDGLCEECKMADYCDIKDEIMNDENDMENYTYNDDDDELPF